MTIIGVPLPPSGGAGHPSQLQLDRAYFDALEAAGATPLGIPILHDETRLRELYDLLDGLLLPGGDDVEPQRYGAEPRDDCHLTLSPELDEIELTLASWAVADDLPVLAICRGIQVLNVACGGTLWQDVVVEGATRESHDKDPRDAPVHGLHVEPWSQLAHTLGVSELEVNSTHHQAIRDVGGDLRAVAHSSDGLIEGVELPGHRFVLGVQCHPEELRKTQPWAARLFEGFVSTAARQPSRA